MFFRLGAYDHDYHPDAIAWWREASGLDGEPPRAWDPAMPARCVAWVRFKDSTSRARSARSRRSLDDVGLGGVARFHNLPPGHHGLYDLRADPARDRRSGRDRRVHAARAVSRAAPARGSRCVGNARADSDRVRGRRRVLPVVPAARRRRRSDARARSPADAARRRASAASTCSWRSSAIATTARRSISDGKRRDPRGVDPPAGRRARRGRLAVAAARRADRARRLPAPTRGSGSRRCAIDPMTPVLAERPRARAGWRGRARHRCRRDRRAPLADARSSARSSSRRSRTRSSTSRRPRPSSRRIAP